MVAEELAGTDEPLDGTFNVMAGIDVKGFFFKESIIMMFIQTEKEHAPKILKLYLTH